MSSTPELGEMKRFPLPKYVQQHRFDTQPVLLLEISIYNTNKVKYRTPEEQAQLLALQEEKVDYLSWKALRETGHLNGPKVGESVIRCLDIISAADEAKFLSIYAKYETFGTISFEEFRFLDYTGRLIILRFCNLAKVNYWDFEGDFEEHDSASDATTGGFDDDMIDEHVWWESPATSALSRWNLKRRHRSL